MDEQEKKLNALVNDSGIITHYKTANILRKKGWSVLVSPYYFDDITGDVREADLIVEKRFDSGHADASSVQLNLQLFVECKYIKQDVVFWFDKINTEKAIANLETETGLRLAHHRSGDITIDGFHYFKNALVAKLFSSNVNKEDVIFKAMNQSLHSLIHYRKTGKRPVIHPFNPHREVYSTVNQYPIIVCDNFNKLSEVMFKETNEFETKGLENHFLLEANYRDDYFLIDMVDINYLESFLSILDDEARTLVNAYSFKHISSNR